MNFLSATNYDPPVKVVVLNNFGDGMVRQWQKLFLKGRLAASDKSLHKKDFVEAAQSDGPAFLEAIIDTEACGYRWSAGPGL